MKIGERGQVTIPVKLRRRFGLKPKCQVEFVELEGRLVLRRSGRDKKADILGKWERHVGVLDLKGRRTDEIMRELRDR
ncbi:MAG: Antidote-toxin recognition MazE, bacterial antitoxin [Verrucomicrobiota bacterium]|jgi:AbrB family looped-hinge helix DNA binding protein